MTIRAYDAPLSAARDLQRSLALMGQDLFNPPNVKGWSEGRDWINTRTLLARVNFASQLTDEMKNRVSLQERLRAFDAATAPSIPNLGGAANDQAMVNGPAMMGAMDAPRAGGQLVGGQTRWRATRWRRQRRSRRCGTV